MAGEGRIMLRFGRGRRGFGALHRREMGETMSMILRGLLLIGLLAGSVMTEKIGGDGVSHALQTDSFMLDTERRQKGGSR